MSIPHAPARLAACALLFAGHALAGPNCPILSCDAGDAYPIQVVALGQECEGNRQRCASVRESPPEVRIDCHASVGGQVCEAWPQGEGLAYAWSVQGSLLLTEPASGSTPLQGIVCVGMGGDGILSVEVLSPFGLSASAQVHLTCP